MKKLIFALLGFACSSSMVFAEPTRISIATSQGTISALDSGGTGPAVLLIHGNSASAKIFKKQFESDLFKQYRLIAVDLPGHGDSEASKNTDTYSFVGYAKALKEMIDELKLKHLVIIGWSLGGHIALELSSLIQNIDGIVITGTPPIKLSPEGIQKGFKPFEGLHLLGHPKPFTREEAITFMGLGGINMQSEEAEFIIQDAMKTEGKARECMFQSIGQGVGNDEVEIVKNMTQPLCIIAGENDCGINNEYIAQLEYANLWNNQMNIIKEAGHAVFWENADEFNKIVYAFLLDTYKTK